MIIARTIESFRQARKNLNGSLGFVPTMGYLHAGHLALVQSAQQANDFTAVSIFVNPAQFNSSADLAAYPRDEARDLAMLEAQGVTLVLIPSAEEMYPPHFQTYVDVEQITQGLEGEYRPGHFRGVATVVSKLFNIVQPDRAYFGQKDAQQVAVIQQMIRDLNIPVQMVVCPTLREPDGLAMSSRNARLSSDERQAAVVLHKALRKAEKTYLSGEKHPKKLVDCAKNILLSEPKAEIEYISINDFNTLTPLNTPSDAPMLLSMAVYMGKVRLIDNIILQQP